MNRRSLLDGDATPTHDRENVFGDEFEVDEWDVVADGFRPTAGAADLQHGARQGAVADDDDDDYDPPIRSVSAHYATGIVDSAISPGSNRNSTRKSRSYANPFASPEDADGTAERAQSLEFEPETNFAHRTLSSASSRVYARTDSPRFGAASHPYGMYTQGTMPRSPSVTTAASTVRQTSQRQSYTQSRPQHPYAMYPQGVDEDLDDDDDDDQIMPNPVPVGFPGLGQNYTRRIGPDGEDQGIVDQDGHTEQLPPYSRYPEDGPEKMPLLPPTLHSRAPVAGTDPGMALMHTTLLPTQTPVPPQQSMSDESALARHSTAHSLARMVSSSSEGTTLKSWQEKTWKEKTWKEKRKTRFCGVPFWWILLTVCVVAFITAVLGGVIGSFVAGGKHHPPGNATVTTTLLYDASLMPSPTSGGPPMGTFAITLGQPEEVQSDCLVDASTSSAWDCNLAPNSEMGLVVQDIVGDGQGSGATLFYNSDDDSIAAGAQLSYMQTNFSPFLTVTDNDDKENGLAFYFQDFYDKIVVIPEHNIDFTNSKRVKRDGLSRSPFVVPAAWRTRKEVLTPGEKPWFCVWNETFVEGFIYINEPTASSTTSSSSSSPSTSASSSSSGTSSPQPTTGTPLTTTPPYYTSPTSQSPTDVITKTITTNTFTTAVYTGPAQGFQDWAGTEKWRAQQRHAYEAGNIYKRQSPGTYATLPYVVKIEERRLPNSPQPYCQQYQILNNGQANWLSDGNGNPIMVSLNEQDPSFGAYESAGTASTSRRKRGTPIPNACHCQWMSGEET